MKKRKYTPDFKRKAVLEAMQGDETVRSHADPASSLSRNLSCNRGWAHSTILRTPLAGG